MSADQLLIQLTFAAYLIVVVAIGWIAYRRTADLADYILGGRRLGRWVTALSAQATAMSGWLLLGLPGFAYAAGVNATWMAGGLLIGTYLNWRFVAAPLRRATERLGNALTLPDYFERRFADASGLLRLVTALFILVFFTVYTSSGLAAGAKLFESVFGIPYTVAVLVGAGAVIAYTLLGGFLAVSWTDALQGMLMFVALLAVAGIGLSAVGGWDATLAGLKARDPALTSLWRDVDGSALTGLEIASLAGWGLGYFGQPHVLARFMALRDQHHMAQARWIAMTWIVLAMTAAVVVGLVGHAALPQTLTGGDTEKVFIELTELLLHPVVAGVCLAGVLAAVMSTADSQLLVASSAVSEDLYKGWLHGRAERGRLLAVGRIAVVALAGIACVIALDPDSRVLELVAYAWAGLGAAFGPALVLSLYWPGMTRAGALGAVITGGGTVLIWRQLQGGLFELYELVPAVVLAVIAAVVLSLGTRTGADKGARPLGRG